ncbi:hypothetical protein [Fructobacillus durionis]|uniref:Tetratricopeptide repeat-containing protein n=1 Tax=Fructobacillus durionis TaxID=283737 RepID=A0A1I1E5J5_9LACO|nr:hypothetical protein [Fructobacillus durionis]SFB82441.1 hypothetical protein SAMN05660453_0314 [Fructobacillus durionis]
MTDINQLKEEGVQALADEEYQKATELLSQVYENDRTYENNQLFAKALLNNNQVNSALTIAQEYVGEYLGQKADYQFYFDVCLAAGYFIMARRMAMESIFSDDREERLRQIDKAEEKAREERSETIQKIHRRFKHIAGYDVLEQQQIYQDAQLLPVEDFVDAAKDLLLDPDIMPIIRVSVLTDIQCLELHRKVRYLYIDGQEYTTILCEQPKPLRDEIYFEARDYLGETVGQDDPITNQMLQEQLRLEMNVLFPQLERVTDPIAWIQADIAMIKGNRMDEQQHESVEQAAIHDYAHRLLSEMGAL